MNKFILNLHKNIDLVQLDIQGSECDALQGAGKVMGKIKYFLIGTHGQDKHLECISILKKHGFFIKFEQPKIPSQPDGIILARKQE